MPHQPQANESYGRCHGATLQRERNGSKIFASSRNKSLPEFAQNEKFASEKCRDANTGTPFGVRKKFLTVISSEARDLLLCESRKRDQGKTRTEGSGGAGFGFQRGRLRRRLFCKLAGFLNRSGRPWHFR